MATATRRQTKRKNTQNRNPRNDKQVNEPLEQQLDTSTTPLSRDSEPLEEGKRPQEAPEFWQSLQDEAPDAGRGTDSWSQEDSSRGRSRS